MSATQSELRLARLIDERETATQLHEGLLADVEKRDEKQMSETERTQVTAYRERAKDLDEEIATLAETVEGNNRSIEQSKKIRRALSGNTDGIDQEDGEVVYRTMAAYARDVILTGNGREAAKIKTNLGDKQEIERAEQRLQLLKRTPANTLTSDVAGLLPQQHIAQIFQVIDSSRPIVASALADDARPRRDHLPEHHRLAGRRRPGGGEDRGREHGHGRRDGDRHRQHVPRRR